MPVIIRIWCMIYPIFSFSTFSRGGHFENKKQKTKTTTNNPPPPPKKKKKKKKTRRGSASQNFPVNITDSYSIGFLSLQKKCICRIIGGEHDGPALSTAYQTLHARWSRIHVFRVVSERFPDNILTQITTPATQLWYEMKAQKSHFLSVPMKFMIKHVLVKEKYSTKYIFLVWIYMGWGGGG